VSSAGVLVHCLCQEEDLEDDENKDDGGGGNNDRNDPNLSAEVSKKFFI